MNRELVNKIAQAVLYEGYILYPYRPSVKNRQRWTFGGLYPKTWSDAQEGTDAWVMQTQCLVEPPPPPPEVKNAQPPKGAAVTVAVRFLHLMNRVVGRLPAPVAPVASLAGEPVFEPVETLDVGGKLHQSWQEATEREVDLGAFDLHSLVFQPRRRDFRFPYHRTVEPLHAEGAGIVGVLVREQQAIEATVELSAESLGNNLLKLTVRILNQTKMNSGGRDDALMRSLVSTHTILGVEGGEFVSATDPPEALQTHATACVNTGAWPVLVGTPPCRDTLLSSPIILYDYPEIAPESPGNLFDSLEIDEILTLRIMTMTDEEKRAMAGVDERARALLQRTEALAGNQLIGLHGRLRPIG